LITVLDDGPGLPAGFVLRESKGIGLRTSMERLEQLYGDEQRFNLSNRTPSGLKVAMVLPARRS
jgi:two-component system LytT family sensor kinase